MSTRGCIARPAGDGWEGRYHHYDSYPTGLGKSLWSYYHEYFKRDVTAMQRYFIDEHPAGWSSVTDCDLSRTPGFCERPTSILTDRDKWDDEQKTPHCYCHGDRHEEAGEPITCTGDCGESCDPLFIEWAYVLAEQGMSIWGSGPKQGSNEYAHYPVAFVRWDAEEPNWEAMEFARNRLYPEPANA